MRDPGGVLFSTDLDGKVDETDTFTCCHCQKVVLVPPKCRPEDLGGWCGSCHKPICPRCAKSGVCDPFEEKLKREEAKYHALRSYGF